MKKLQKSSEPSNTQKESEILQEIMANLQSSNDTLIQRLQQVKQYSLLQNEKLFEDGAFDQELVSNIYKELNESMVENQKLEEMNNLWSHLYQN